MKIFPILNNDKEFLTLTEQEIIKAANSKEAQKLIDLMKKDILMELGYLNGFFDLLKNSIE
jgi:hypothetical protein